MMTLLCLWLLLGIVLLVGLAGWGVRRTRFLDVHPQYRQLLKWHGLDTVEDFLELSGVIVSGHSHRNVAHVEIGKGASPLHGYLKREYQVYWRDYLASAWAGFGWVSRSYREAQTLRALWRAGVRCPEVIATGQDGQGRAFLLVRELSGARELRYLLRENPPETPRERRVLADKLGRALAHMHAAGFVHGDLYATHVLVHPADWSIHLVDWQRSRCDVRARWRPRLNDLAALDATLDGQLASPRDRLACVRAYLRESAAVSPSLPPLPFDQILNYLDRRSRHLMRKRHIRETRQAPLAIGTQNLIWVKGEALCVTREFQAMLNGEMPDWLSSPAPEDGNCLTWEAVNVPGAHSALLVRRRSSRPWHWLWQRLFGQRFTSPELQQAAALFRLERHGVVTPRLLAVGQLYTRPWRTESFLLTAAAPARLRLTDWLGSHPYADGRRFRGLLRAAGQTLRRLHDAHCYLDDATGEELPLFVRTSSDGSADVVLGNVTGLHTRRRASRSRARRDLARLCRVLASRGAGRRDALRLLRAYTGKTQRSWRTRQHARTLLAGLPFTTALVARET